MWAKMRFCTRGLPPACGSRASARLIPLMRWLRCCRFLFAFLTSHLDRLPHPRIALGRDLAEARERIEVVEGGGAALGRDSLEQHPARLGRALRFSVEAGGE